MRDTKGRFKKGFDGMRPVGMKKAKLDSFKKKAPEKTLNAPVNSASSGFGPKNVAAPNGARVNVNVGAIKRGPSMDGSTGVKRGGAMITKTQGDVVRGDTNLIGMPSNKLSKGQKDRLATRDANMLTGARNKKRWLGGEQRNPAEAVQASNNAKLQDARTMTPAQKIANYQEMHGKKPSAAATKKLGPDRASIAFTNDGIAARQASKPKIERKSTAQMVREQEARDALKPAGADQQKVVAPSAMTHDEALARMNEINNRLGAAHDARVARGGKTTSAEEKRLKKEFEAARQVRQDIAMRNANSRPVHVPTAAEKAASDKMSAAARDRAAKPTVGGGRQKADLGSMITDFAASKGISESQLKAGGNDQKAVVKPKGRYAKVVAEARIPTRNNNGDWMQNRRAQARTERRVAQMKVEKADTWGDRKVSINGVPQGSVRKRTTGEPVMDGRIRIGSYAPRGYTVKTKSGQNRVGTGDNRLGPNLQSLSMANDEERKRKAQTRLDKLKGGVESRKAQRRAAPRMAEKLNAKIIASQTDGTNQWNRTKQQRLDQEKTIRQRNLAEKLARPRTKDRLRAGAERRKLQLELKRTAADDGTLQTQGFGGNITKLRNGKFADLDRGTYTKDAWPRESNGVQITTQKNKRTGVVRVRSVPLHGAASNTYYVNAAKQRKARLKEIAARNARY
jgi:hypothetical protein